MSVSLSPPPRKQYASPNTTARLPKLSVPSEDHGQEQEQDLDHALAQLLSQQAQISHSRHIPECKHHPSSQDAFDANTATLGSELLALRSGRKPSQSLFPPEEEQAYARNTTKADDGEAWYENNTSPALSMALSCSYCDNKQGGSNSGLLDDIHRMKTDALLCQQRMSKLRAMVPQLVRRRLNYHLDECWFVHFSPSGEFLASIGLDQTIALWHDMMSPEPSVYKTFNYKRTVTQVEWSPNSQYLLANLGYDLARPDFVPELHLISVETGETLFAKSYSKNGQCIMVSSITWFSDSKRFLTATDDGLYCIWNVDGKIIREITVPKAIRAEHIRMIPGKDEALIYTKTHTLEHLSLGETVSSKRVDEVSGRTMAVNISRQGKYLALSSKVDEELHRPAQISLYDLKTMSYLRSFEAETYINNVFMIIPAFAGCHEELLCAGSENGKLHFWDVETGEVVSVLDEHSSHSGCISVHPSQAGMAVSCSDDNTIIIWVTDELQHELQAGDERWMQRLRGVIEPPLDIKNGW